MSEHDQASAGEKLAEARAISGCPDATIDPTATGGTKPPTNQERDTMYRIIATDSQGHNCTTAEILGDAYGRLYISPTAARDAIETVKDGLTEAGVTEDIDLHPLADDSLVEAVHDYLSAVELPEGITLRYEWTEDADGVVEAIIIMLLSAGGAHGRGDVGDAIALDEFGLRFVVDGELGAHIGGGVTYDGGTYQRWAL